ncbi:MAG: cadmium resistance transporter [Methanobacterium sp.]
MIFFANSSFKNSHIVIGQYMGIISLILISSLGYFFKFIIPTSFISLLGIFPIIIGIKELIKLKRHQKSNEKYQIIKTLKDLPFWKLPWFLFLTVQIILEFICRSLPV